MEDDATSKQQLEEALLELIDHHTQRLHHLKKKVTSYTSKLQDAEKRLTDSRSKLALLRAGAAPTSPPRPRKRHRTPSPALDQQAPSVRSHCKDLISTVRSRPSPTTINLHSTTLIPTHHTRKLRTIALNPLKQQLFLTSSLDGAVKLWELQMKGSTASLISSIDCFSPRLRSWPEDIAWHPNGETVVAAYSAAGNEPQLSIMNFTSSEKEKPHFLEERPHQKGLINSVIFMPWEESCFSTGGTDHAVILWTETKGSYLPKTVHRSEHSSAVTGVAGLQQKKIIVSVGMDKRLIGFDLLAGSSTFQHVLDSKCLAVLPNPHDVNLLMVQTAFHGKQMRLIDIRTQSGEIHGFGYEPESSKSHSNLIKPAWSPDGVHVSTGCVDPKIHIFDIRHSGGGPAQSIQAHRKRVLQAEWHPQHPLLVSLSLDRRIGLHRIS